MKIPSSSLQPIIAILEEHGLISASGEDPTSYLPARDIETITIASMIEVIRHAEASPFGGKWAATGNDYGWRDDAPC
jgi:hypothetical protein